MENQAVSAGFWDNPAAAERILKETKNLKIWTDGFKNAETKIEDFEVMFEFWKAGDASEEDAKEAFKLPKPDGECRF